MPQTLLVSEWCSSEPLRAVDDLYNLVQTDLAFSARRSSSRILSAWLADPGPNGRRVFGRER